MLFAIDDFSKTIVTHVEGINRKKCPPFKVFNNKNSIFIASKFWQESEIFISICAKIFHNYLKDCDADTTVFEEFPDNFIYIFIWHYKVIKYMYGRKLLLGMDYEEMLHICKNVFVNYINWSIDASGDYTEDNIDKFYCMAKKILSTQDYMFCINLLCKTSVNVEIECLYRALENQNLKNTDYLLGIIKGVVCNRIQYKLEEKNVTQIIQMAKDLPTYFYTSIKMKYDDSEYFIDEMKDFITGLNYYIEILKSDRLNTPERLEALNHFKKEIKKILHNNSLVGNLRVLDDNGKKHLNKLYLNVLDARTRNLKHERKKPNDPNSEYNLEERYSKKRKY
jgi:hypothetical protein